MGSLQVKKQSQQQKEHQEEDQKQEHERQQQQQQRQQKDEQLKDRDAVEWDILQWVEKSLHGGDFLSIVDIVGEYNRQVFTNKVCDRRTEEEKRNAWRRLVLSLNN